MSVVLGLGCSHDMWLSTYSRALFGCPFRGVFAIWGRNGVTILGNTHIGTRNKHKMLCSLETEVGWLQCLRLCRFQFFVGPWTYTLNPKPYTQVPQPTKLSTAVEGQGFGVLCP